MCVTVAVSATVSASEAAITVTVCAELQFEVENVSLDGFTVTSVLSVGSTMVTATPLVGWVSSTTVYVPLLPSVTVSDVGVTVTPRVSSSVTVTVRLASLTEL